MSVSLRASLVCSLCLSIHYRHQVCWSLPGEILSSCRHFKSWYRGCSFDPNKCWSDLSQVGPELICSLKTVRLRAANNPCRPEPIPVKSIANCRHKLPVEQIEFYEMSSIFKKILASSSLCRVCWRKVRVDVRVVRERRGRLCGRWLLKVIPRHLTKERRL